MGRTGKWWACEYSGIEPDILCTRKGNRFRNAAERDDRARKCHGLGAAARTLRRLAVILCRSPRRWSLSACSSEATWLMPRAWAPTSFATPRTGANGIALSATFAEAGLMIGVEFVHDQDSKEKAPDLRNRIVQMAFQKGLLLLGAGENSIRLSPPLMVEEEQAGVRRQHARRLHLRRRRPRRPANFRRGNPLLCYDDRPASAGLC